MSKKIDVVMAFVIGLIVALSCSSCGSGSADDSYKSALSSLDSGKYKQAERQLVDAVKESSPEQALSLVSQIKEDEKRYFEKHDYQAQCCLYVAAIAASFKGWGASADDSNVGPLYEKLIVAQINNGQYQAAEETLNRSLYTESGNLPESPDKNRSSNVTALARRVARTGEYLERKDQHAQAQHLYNQALKMLADNQQDKDYWLLARIHADLGSSLKIGMPVWKTHTE